MLLRVADSWLQCTAPIGNLLHLLSGSASSLECSFIIVLGLIQLLIFLLNKYPIDRTGLSISLHFDCARLTYRLMCCILQGITLNGGRLFLVIAVDKDVVFELVGRMERLLLLMVGWDNRKKLNVNDIIRLLLPSICQWNRRAATEAEECMGIDFCRGESQFIWKCIPRMI